MLHLKLLVTNVTVSVNESTVKRKRPRSEVVCCVVRTLNPNIQSQTIFLRLFCCYCLPYTLIYLYYIAKGQYIQALENYKAASKIQQNDPVYWNLMAACYERLKNWDKMAVASRNTITVDRNFIQGYYRLAIAQRELGELNNCHNTVDYGLNIQPNNKP